MLLLAARRGVNVADGRPAGETAEEEAVAPADTVMEEVAAEEAKGAEELAPLLPVSKGAEWGLDGGGLQAWGCTVRVRKGRGGRGGGKSDGEKGERRGRTGREVEGRRGAG